MATITFGTTAGGWNTAALWVGGVKPSAADDAVLAATSGNCTIDAASVCRSLDASAYGADKTLTHNAFTLTVGDSVAGAGNKALDFSGGFTYTLANAATSATSFQSSSATQQTINFAGKTTAWVNNNIPQDIVDFWDLTEIIEMYKDEDDDDDNVDEDQSD